jgi:hypothetical protein
LSPSDPSDPNPGSASSAIPAAPAKDTPGTPRDAAYWARQGTDLKAGAVPRNEVNNVDGRSAVSPLQGFGKMWQRTYRVQLTGASVTPVEVIRAWKDNFPSFWPRGNRFYLPLTGITPGEVAILRVKAGGMPLSTGVLVLYADDESFTLMTPQGHVLAGWITFSSYVQDDVTVAQAQVLVRANDPIYEFGARFLGGFRQENKFWQHTLRSVAAHFGVTSEPIQTEVVCVDPHVRWRYTGNIRYNAAIRTILLGPTHWLRRVR